jgi:hypothetical protein
MQAVVAWKRQSSHLYHPHPQVSSLFWAGLQRESARTPRHHGPDLHSTPTENQAAIINNALKHPGNGAIGIEQTPGLAS